MSIEREALIDDLQTLKAAVAGISVPEKEYCCYGCGVVVATGIGATEVQLNLNFTIVNNFTSTFVASSNRITVNKTGKFMVSVDVALSDANRNSNTFKIYVKKNTTALTAGDSYIESPSTASRTASASIQYIVDITSGDYLSIYAIRSAGVSTTGAQVANATRITIVEL